ncbi:HAMP domain-containing histidine kinase [bacterium]|nr:HAMP domain-containing histidine kinase [bacterium]
MLGIFSFGLVNILLNYKNLGKVEKIQLKYFLFAIIIPILGVIPTNAFLPLVGNFEYIWVGPLSMSVTSVILTLGIATKNSSNKYDVQVFFLKTFLMTLYIFEIFFLTHLFYTNFMLITNILETSLWMLIFVIIALSSYYLGTLLIKVIVKEVFKDKIPDHTKIRDKYLDITADVLNADTLKNITTEQIMHSVSLEWCGIISVDQETNITMLLSNNKPDFVFKENFNVLIENVKDVFENLDNVCNKDEIIYILTNDYKRFRVKLLERMKRVSVFLNSVDASEIMIINSINDTKEICLLGYKMGSAASINPKERNLINSLLKNLSLALLRANLHTQVEIANTSLKQRVSAQTYKLKQQVEELEKARRKERDMIDIMGHELRTPISIIKLNTDLLHNFSTNVTREKKDFTKYVARIKNAVEVEIKLINTLLSSAKLEGDKIELNYEKIDLTKQIKTTLYAHNTQVKQKGLKLITDLSPNATYVYADHARIAEIINNLIDNAVKYTDKGDITIKTEDGKNFIKISIIDTGRGMSKEDLSALGTKFFRIGHYIESEDSDDFNIVRPGGTGLGLYVSFSLIKRMGGEVKVESKLGEGSNFSFTLPKYTGQVVKKRADTKDMFARLGLNEAQKR